MIFTRRVFLIAAATGFIVLVPQYFLEAKTGRDFQPAIKASFALAATAPIIQKP